MKYSKQLVIRMTEEMYDKLKKLAEKDKRSVADYIRLQLEKLVK